MNINNFLSRFEGVKKTGDHKWMVRCSAHPDRNPSLSITDKPDKILVICRAGCVTENVLAKVGLRMADRYPDNNGKSNGKFNIPPNGAKKN